MHNNMMMDPEMIRLAQEQMSKISPSDLAKLQQQMMSNPELIRLATESMKNMRPEDMRNAAEQLKNARPEDMAEITEKMAKATPEEIAAMRAHADAQASYEFNAAQMLKKEGNDLHGQGKYSDAALKYLHAKNNLKSVPVAKGRALQLACSLNLMSCYLKTMQYEDCIKEGSEVLQYDAENVKALYRRGQAYKALGKLKAAVSDLSNAHKISPDDETIADVLRDAKEKLSEEGESQHVSRGVIIEEITEEEICPTPSEFDNSSSATEYSVMQLQEAGESPQGQGGSNIRVPTTDAECLQGLKDNPEAIRSFQNFLSNADPNAFAALGAGGMPPEMVKTASGMISKMSPEELQKMLEMASSLNGKGSLFPTATADTSGRGSAAGLQPPPGMSPDMVKTASDMISKMSPQELQKMFEVAASLKGKDGPFPMAASDANSDRSKMPQSAGTAGVSAAGESSSGDENISRGLFENSRTGRSSSNLPSSGADLQDQMRNQMKDPAMRQMFTSMIQNMNPDMMASMSEQFGVKLSREEAAKAQQAMSSMSPEDLDRMMRWADRIQKTAEGARKTKNWLLGRPGMILAICMLILAIVLHRLGYIGG
ncbi:outer envelope protein 61 isoform X1 [Magnolia sinica]|uniref:outer envelope protein 61 isoform X1 n=1 Tax=Magnolia sinica TaxID=86752 RepID=UPI00265A1DAC|nr:outer envelope protein 61 isoform X1 [Magnolia sinica]